MPNRFAIYYAPATTDALWDRASAWLGRDAANGDAFDGSIAGIERSRLLDLTQSAGRYGFHATIKPPMALPSDRGPDELRAALADFAAKTAPVALGRLRLAGLDGFLALVPEEENNADLADFAANVVETFEPFRAPLSQRDRAARLAHGLTPRQEELLDAYGYPYVFDQFRLHMTLTDRLSAEERQDVEEAAATWFAPVLDAQVLLDRLVLYEEPEGGTPFRRREDYLLGGTAQ